MTKLLAGTKIMLTIGMLFKNNKKKNQKQEETNLEETLLCRFVLDGIGRKIGESVAIDDDILIIKKGKKYLGVPLKHIERKEKTLLVKGLVDQHNAELMGNKWKEENFNTIKHPTHEES